MQCVKIVTAMHLIQFLSFMLCKAGCNAGFSIKGFKTHSRNYDILNWMWHKVVSILQNSARTYWICFPLNGKTHYNWPICSPQTFANASCEYTCGKVKNHYKKHFIYLKHKNSECFNLRLKPSQWCHIRCTHRCQDLTLGYAWNGSGHFKTNFAISFPTPKARIREAKISTWRQPPFQFKGKMSYQCMVDSAGLPVTVHSHF